MTRKDLIARLGYALPMEVGEVADPIAMADLLIELLADREVGRRSAVPPSPADDGFVLRDDDE